MTARVIAFIIFLLAIVVIYHFSPSPSIGATDKVGYIAIRKLPANTRLNSTLWTFEKGHRPTALWSTPKQDDFVGKYLRHGIAQGDPIIREDLSDSPQLTVNSNQVLFTYSLSDLGPVGGYLNAGAKVYVCDQEKSDCTHGPYEVLALVGDVKAPLALISATSQQAMDLSKIKKPYLRGGIVP